MLYIVYFIHMMIFMINHSCLSQSEICDLSVRVPLLMQFLQKLKLG